MTVSFVIVAFNEESTLPTLLKDLKAQDYPHDKIEVLLIDSMSSDGTFDIMQNFANGEHDFLRVAIFKNEKKILPSGCNVALKNYTGDAIVRIDAHASIPTDFISKNVLVLEGGENVSGGRRPCIIDQETPWKKTLFAAEESMFGSSIAAYRRGENHAYVSSVFHGMYRREVYDNVGLYDERLARTEDNDMSYRIRQAGYKICYNPDIVSYQHVRNTLGKMLRQKFLNGYWIGKTMGINPHCFSVFHFVPFLFVMGIILTTVMGIFGLPLLSALMWGAYGILTVAMTVVELVKEPSAFKLLLPILFLLLHVCYGIGTLKGLIEMPFWKRRVTE